MNLKNLLRFTTIWLIKIFGLYMTLFPSCVNYCRNYTKTIRDMYHRVIYQWIIIFMAFLYDKVMQITYEI